MREIMFRGKRMDNGDWVYGYYVHIGPVSCQRAYIIPEYASALYVIEVDPFTVGQYTGLKDKNGKRIFEGDIVQYNTLSGYVCRSIVKLGQYEQDGSGSEYPPTQCLGFFAEVIEVVSADWCDNEPKDFPIYYYQRSIQEVYAECEIIGNINDNPELLKEDA